MIGAIAKSKDGKWTASARGESIGKQTRHETKADAIRAVDARAK